MRARWILVVSLITGCGSGGGNVDAGDGDGDGDGDGAVVVDAPVLPDAGPTCGVTWQRVEVPTSVLTLLDPAPLNGARGVRVSVLATMGDCDLLAMPAISFTLESEDAFIQMFAFRPLGTDCTDGATQVQRPVLLDLYPGQWRIHAGSPPGTETITVVVAQPPDRACNPNLACEMDCDCPEGQRCLGGYGIAGPFTSCAVPCELDRDCAGTGVCNDFTADGLQFYCETGTECDGSRPCPSGYDCNNGVCELPVVLGSQTRVTCDCDADCEAPLRCVEADYFGRERRCELACPTAGPWCNGAHFCGGYGQDVANLAPTDSVCVWAGD